MDIHRRAVAWLVALAFTAAAVAGCLDPLSAARGGCGAQGVGDLRCRAIVADARSRLRADAPPITGVDVAMATLEDRDTLRAQQLVATVRFSFLDGSKEEVPVFCRPRLARTPVCRETGP